jgi:DnaJ-class molecular chaperone
MMDADKKTPLTHGDSIDLGESVAGEEDPGASIDLDQRASAKSDQPTTGGRQPSGAQAPMSPGDEAPPGTPGTGEDICPDCGGTGKRAGRECPTCQGTGKVTVGIGGA